MAMHSFMFFFFNDTATTEIYTLSLHDALPISPRRPDRRPGRARCRAPPTGRPPSPVRAGRVPRSEEHTSELQSPCNLVCRLLLEKKKTPILPVPDEWAAILDAIADMCIYRYSC